MKKFLIRIIAFFVIWITLTIPIDIFITRLVRSSHARAIEVWEDIFNGRIDADMLFLGSSRTSDAYDPTVFDSM